MPSEERRLIFNKEETYRALYALCVQQGFAQMPAGMVINIEEDPKDPKSLNFTIENNQQEKTEIRAFGRDFVAAALMLFCRGASIPLPRKGKKIVEVEDNTLILHVSLDNSL